MNAGEVVGPEDTAAPLLKRLQHIEGLSQFFAWSGHLLKSVSSQVYCDVRLQVYYAVPLQVNHDASLQVNFAVRERFIDAQAVLLFLPLWGARREYFFPSPDSL